LPTKRRRSGSGRTTQRPRRSAHDQIGIIPVLAKAVREVEAAVQRGRLTGTQRARFQAIAILARAERARVQVDPSLTGARRDTELKRLDGVAKILAQTAAREASLFTLLDEAAEVSDAARRWKREMQIAGGQDPDPAQDPEVASRPASTADRIAGRVVPQSVAAAQMANPFLAPDFTAAGPKAQGLLVGWELIGPLLNSFEHAPPGAPACMELPPAGATATP
jgi:hypothetical protein